MLKKDVHHKYLLKIHYTVLLFYFSKWTHLGENLENTIIQNGKIINPTAEIISIPESQRQFHIHCQSAHDIYNVGDGGDNMRLHNYYPETDVQHRD